MRWLSASGQTAPGREARQTGKEVHFGYLLGLCFEKGSELPEGHLDRKFKGRSVFQGDRVVNQKWEVALFQDLGSNPGTGVRCIRVRPRQCDANCRCTGSIHSGRPERHPLLGSPAARRLAEGCCQKGGFPEDDKACRPAPRGPVRSPRQWCFLEAALRSSRSQNRF